MEQTEMLGESADLCRLCGGHTTKLFHTKLLMKYDVGYTFTAYFVGFCEIVFSMRVCQTLTRPMILRKDLKTTDQYNLVCAFEVAEHFAFPKKEMAHNF